MLRHLYNKHAGWICPVVLLLGLLIVRVNDAAENLSPDRWEEDIQAFEKMDREAFPPEDAVLFVGSSSIRIWDLKRDFPSLKAINRGFGGSQMADCLYYADRIVLPYKPRTIVLYEGDNDINDGKTPSQIHDDYVQFVKRVHAKLPKTKIIFIAIKPSIKRWHLIEQIREANKLIRDYTEREERLVYLDVDTPAIGADGKPMPDIFKDDGLHLNEKGYEIWAELLWPHLR